MTKTKRDTNERMPSPRPHKAPPRRHASSPPKHGLGVCGTGLRAGNVYAGFAMDAMDVCMYERCPAEKGKNRAACWEDCRLDLLRFIRG